MVERWRGLGGESGFERKGIGGFTFYKAGGNLPANLSAYKLRKHITIFQEKTF